MILNNGIATITIIIAIFLIVTILVIVLTVLALNNWKQADHNAYEIFGGMFKIEEIPQPERTPFPTYRAYNPCIFNMNNDKLNYNIDDIDDYWTAFRMCNFIQCPDKWNNWDKNRRYLTNSHTILVSPWKERYLISHPDVSGKTINGAGCEKGCEDSRIVCTNNEIFIICNSTSGFDCTREMRLMRIYLSEMFNNKKFKHEGINVLHDIKVNNTEKLKIDWTTAPKNTISSHDSIINANNNKQIINDEKNWMPWIHENELHFVYSVNPHIILKYVGYDKTSFEDKTSDYNVIVVSSNKYNDNPNLPRELRGGSQIIKATKWHKKKLGEGFIAEDLYIAATHVRNSNKAYMTYIYAFEVSYPFAVKYITKGFVFGDKASHSQGIQFAAGLARVVKNNIYYLKISYGEDDCSSKLCTIKEEDVMKALIKVIDD